MRIIDGSSYVCSSDLNRIVETNFGAFAALAQSLDHVERHRASKIVGFRPAFESDARYQHGERPFCSLRGPRDRGIHRFPRLTLVDEPRCRGDLQCNALRGNRRQEDMGTLPTARAAHQPGGRTVASGVTQLAATEQALGAATHPT